jgi:hypothetical protein
MMLVSQLQLCLGVMLQSMLLDFKCKETTPTADSSAIAVNAPLQRMYTRVQRC